MKATIFPLALLVAFVASTAAQPLTFRTGSTNTTGSTTSARSPWDQARLKSKTLKQSWPQRRAMFSTNLIASSGTLNKDSSVRTRKGVANTGASVKSTIVERGVHHQIVRSVSTVTNLNGVASFRTNTYTELATGMNYQDSGEWKKTRELIEPFAEGAIARLGPHKVIFAANLNSPVVIDFETPDGKRLRSRVLGLSYFDASTGKAVLIAETQDSVGQIVGSNQVIFTNAFDGVDASVQYVYRKDGFQQNIVLHAPPPPPTEFKLNPATTRLQVLTEFFDPPAARTESLGEARRGNLVDVAVNFGQMTIGAGRAFALGQEEDADNSVMVSKQWTIQDGRTFLVEQVPYEKVDRQLKALATKNQGAAVTPRHAAQGGNVIAALKSALPQRKAKSSTGPMLMAKLTEQTRSGFVLDYELLASQANFTFKGDTTYYVSGTVNLSGATKIEGGAVVKFSSGTTPKINITGTVECKTSAYRPAVFTARDDDTVGEALDVSTGTVAGKYGNGLTINASGSVLKHIRFCYANSAIRLGFSSGQIDLAHLQFFNSFYGVDFNGNSEDTVNVVNSLFYSITNATKSGYDNYLRGQHLTIDHCLKLFAIGNGNHNGEVHLTNSVLANVAHRGHADVYEGTHNGFYLSPQFGVTPFTATASPFQTAVAGEHYLTDASGFRTVGNASIAASMLTDLKTRTTHPPIVFPTLLEITGELALFPQVPRYTSGSPDLGYHYDVLDYIVPGMVVDGGTITVQPGTAIGFLGDFAYWETWGFGLGENSAFISEGTPTKPNTFASIQLVQEGLAYNGVVGLLAAFSWGHGLDSSPPQIRLRFSNFYLAALDYVLWAGWGEDDDPDVDGFYYTATSSMNWSLRDCSIYGGRINLGTPEDPVNPAFVWPSGSVSWVNNLFERVRITLDPSYYWHDPEDPILMNVDLAFAAYNNLFRGGRLRIRSVPATQGNWVFKDNLFDKVRFKHHTDPSLPLDHDNNGYWPCTTELATGETAKLVPVNWDTHVDAANDAADFTAAPPYQTGPLGYYYLPASPPLNNAGSRTPADAGLFHFTTRFDQTKAGNESGNVNIGLHYAATMSSTSKQPKDSDAGSIDGIPDYAEDVNGDGQWSSGLETDWQDRETDEGTADALNAIYNHVDLDGDGMVGLVEKLWDKNPLELDNPLCVDVIPQSVHGVETVPINLPLAYAQDETGVQMMILSSFAEGPQEAEGAELQVQGVSAPTFEWNTAYDPFGENLVFFRKSVVDECSPVPGYIQSVWVDNEFQMNPAFRMFGDHLVVEAQSIYPNGYYRIGFFDANNDPLTYTEGGQVKNFSRAGQADAFGWIDDSWDLVFPDQTTFTPETVKITLAVVPASAGNSPTECNPAAACPPFIRDPEASWGQYDKFITFFGSMNDVQAEDDWIRWALFSAVHGPLMNESLPGQDYSLNPHSGWIEYAGWPPLWDLRGLYTWKFTREVKEDILSTMAEEDYRNLFYSGHSVTDRLTTARPEEGESADRIFQKDISDVLLNPPRNGIPSHPYRFVFLFSCCTGRGNMCRAFGIPKGSWSVQDFTRRGLRARAFIGNNDPEGSTSHIDEAPEITEQAEQEIDKLQLFFTRWRTDVAPLSTILDLAKETPTQVGIHPSYRIHGATSLRRSSP